jgi:hypothetical protein
MKTPGAIALALLLAVSAATAPQPAKGGSVTGTVLCGDTHAPARGAYVSLQSPASTQPGPPLPRGDTFGAQTGIDGSFTIAGVTPGDYYVVVWHPGYISAKEYIYPGALSPQRNGGKDPLPSFVQRVTIVAGGTARVAIQLQRGGTISGAVRYSDGAPVSDVALTPKLKLSDGSFADAGAGASHTDAAGHYRIDGLADGSYVVLGGIAGASVPGFGGDRISGSGLMIFAGGGMRPSKARVIAVSGAHEYAAGDITIPLTGLHEVGGMVTAPDGHRLNRGLVRLYPAGEPRFPVSAPLEADGAFNFHGIPADRYTILVGDASDWKLTPKGDGALRYDERTLVATYGTAAVDVEVGDTDLGNVTLTVSPIR